MKKGFRIPKKLTKKQLLKQQYDKVTEAINALNMLIMTYLAPSPIHGIGVFASRTIKKGERIGLDYQPNAFDVPYSRFNELRHEVRDILLNCWPEVVKGSHFMYPVTRMMSFVNHSNTPNVDIKTDKALEDIVSGEELTADYKLFDNAKEIYPWLVAK